MLRRLKIWLRKMKHQHDWRPARTSLGPAKYCDTCEKIVQLSDEEFYAEFERIPHYI